MSVTLIAPPRAPQSDVDLFTDAALADPYPIYKTLRDLGGAVWSPRYQAYFIGRYEDVRAALRNWQVFSSAHGTGLNEVLNARKLGTILASDPPAHDEMRRVLAPPLSPAAIRDLTDMVQREAEYIVALLTERGTFDLLSDLSTYLPFTIVRKLVGLPEAGQFQMRQWGLAGFDANAPINLPRTGPGMATVLEMIKYLTAPDLADHVLPGGWADNLFKSVARGEITQEQCRKMLIDYVAPSLETTISGLSNTLWLLAKHPAQWDAVRADPAVIPYAILEGLRLESPIQMFSRVTTEAVTVDEVTIAAGARVILLYGSANRDERKYPDPERFDVTRRPHDHLAFGHGVHVCVGMHLAQLEMRMVIAALARRAPRLELGEVVRSQSYLLRGFDSIPVTVRAA